MRTLPVKMIFQTQKGTNNFDYKIEVNKQEIYNNATIVNNAIEFTNFNANLPLLYKDYNKIEQHNFTFHSADIELINNHSLVLKLNGKNNFYKEKSSPKMLVLTKENQKNNTKDIAIDIITDKQDHFLTLYPNPFEAKLLIQYELLEGAITTVEVYTLDGTYHNKLIDKKLQLKGVKTIKLDASTLSTGPYVVRVTTNGVIHTKLILKK